MSITLVCAVLVLIGLFLRGKVTLFWVCVLVPTLLLPTAINETKGTLILLPVGMLGMGYLTSSGKARVRNLLALTGVVGLFITSFIAAYDYFYTETQGGIGLSRFFTEQAVSDFYKEKELGGVGRVGRFDSIVFAYDDHKEDPTILAFGRGLGNVTHPGTTEVISGAYSENYDVYGVGSTTYTVLLWDLGIIGILLTLLTLAMICADARALQAKQGVLGGLAMGWVGVTVMLPVAFFYKDVIHPDVIGHLGMFYSGIVVAERLRALAQTKGLARVETHVRPRAGAA